MLCLALLFAVTVADLQSALASNNIQQVQAVEKRLLHEDTKVGTLLAAGAILAQHDMLSDAAEIFESCTERYPESFEAKYNLALARIGLRQFDRASAALEGLPKSAAVDYLRGRIFLATGRLAEARQNLESAYRGNLSDENYALELGLADIRSSAYVPAIEVLQPALASHPESQELTLELAISDALAGRAEDAVAVCRKLDQPTAQLISAFAECFRENYAACETESAAGLAVPHPNPYLHYLHAEAVWNLRPSEREKIRADLDKVSCSVCLLLRSRVSDEPIVDLQKALAKDPKLAPAWYRLSVLYRQNGQTAEATEALRRYRELHDNLQNAEIESFQNELLR